jgi:uncharacterized protein (TIGR02687 family)
MQDIFTIQEKVQAALERLFQQHRLIFWYDDKAEMTNLFEDLQIPGVEKMNIENNEFELKHRLLIEQPLQRFLLYQPKEKPEDHENWLLDLLLSNYAFHTEASALYLQDLELPQEFKALIHQHEEFFANQKRINDLKALIETGDTENKIRLKMLAVICACEPEWEKVWYALFAEALKQKQDKYKAIEKYGLDRVLWETAEMKMNYKPATPAIKDLILQLIVDDFERCIPDGKPMLNREAYLFVNRWKENTKARPLFRDWSLLMEQELGMEDIFQTIAPENLLAADTYAGVDKKLIIGIRDHILNNTLSNFTLQEWIEKRSMKFFFSDYTQIYSALSHAAELLDEIRKMDLKIQSPEDGFEKYERQWFKIDRLYRKYIAASEQAEHQNILKSLTAHIEKAYGNSFLLKLGDNWQGVLDGMKSWDIEQIISQKQFYQNWVAPYVERDNRIFVIISDALRYESATELREMIIQEGGYTAKMNAVLGSIPSYTQLGMASLLPHTHLTYNDQSDTVFADGVSTQGMNNRTKILQKKHEGSIAIGAEDFLKMKSGDGRDFIKPYNVVYIFSNLIDKMGDDKASEGKVFQATEDEFANLLKIIKHINNMNGYNMIITTDHGYLYQHNRLDESDFTGFTPVGEVYKCSRRFVLGKELVANVSVQKWHGASIGFGDDTELLLPKSINRIRIQGAGSRFLHGGASLQEIVIPVLEINKARKSDIEQVEIDIISGSSNITSTTFGVSFYQKQAVAEKILSRQIKAGFYTASGKLISDVASLAFNSTNSDAAAREQQRSFIFNMNASKFNGQDVFLKLEESIEGTSQNKIYKSFTYRMMIAFSNEFDNL